MDIDMFSKMLLGEDPAEAYIESAEAQKEIKVNSSLFAVIHILAQKEIVTNEEFEEVRKKYEASYIEKIKKAFKKEFEKLEEE